MVKILVVEDNKNTRALMKEVLEAAQYSVYTAENGEEALVLMEKQHIDLVMLDVMMPKMDGYEFTKMLREMQNDLPLLMVSAKQLPQDRSLGFKAGVDDFMSKPVDEEEMLLRIKALLRRAKIATDRQIVIGEATLDYDTYTVSRQNGENQLLPQKEFELLYKLLAYSGKIFTRIQLMDEIWGVDSDTGWETVTVHIAKLRKRFADWPEFTLESVRGLGYRAVKHQ